MELAASFCLLNLCSIPVCYRVQEPRYHYLRKWLLQGSMDAKPQELVLLFLSLLYKGISCIRLLSITDTPRAHITNITIALFMLVSL